MLWCTLADPTKNALWMDPDHAKLVQYLPKFINEDLSGRLQLTIRTLISAYPPLSPGCTEQRRRSFLQWKASLPEGTPCGVYRLTVHHQVGHPKDYPSISGHLGRVSSVLTQAATAFRGSDAITELSRRISTAIY